MRLRSATWSGTRRSHPGVYLDVFGAGGFTFDAFRNAGMSYSYVNKTDFLRNPTAAKLISGGGTSNTTSTASGSVSLLFRTLGAGEITGQRYLFSAGSLVAEHNAFALFLENTNAANGDPNALKLRFGNSTTTILPAASIAPSTCYTNHTGQRFLFSAGGATAATNAFAVFMENWTASTDPGAIKVRLGNSSKAILH